MALDWGAEVAIDPSSDDPVSAIKDLSHGEGADKTFDCTSSIDIEPRFNQPAYGEHPAWLVLVEIYISTR